MSNISPREVRRRAEQSRRDKEKAAFEVEDLPYGRTYTYQLIREGKLKAKKCGKRTIVTREDWREHEESLPYIKSAAA